MFNLEWALRSSFTRTARIHLYTMLYVGSALLWAPAAEAEQHDIVFQSNRSGCDELWTASSKNPTDLNQVTTFNCNDGAVWPRWSPDGQWVAFDRSSEIFVVRGDGSAAPVHGGHAHQRHIPLGTIMDKLGHQSPSVTLRYLGIASSTSQPGNDREQEPGR